MDSKYKIVACDTDFSYVSVVVNCKTTLDPLTTVLMDRMDCTREKREWVRLFHVDSVPLICWCKSNE